MTHNTETLAGIQKMMTERYAVVTEDANGEPQVSGGPMSLRAAVHAQRKLAKCGVLSWVVDFAEVQTRGGL